MASARWQHAGWYLWNILLFGVLPFFIWRAIDLWTGSAILVGPFLLASPFIAVFWARIAAASFKCACAFNRSVSDPNLEELANRFAAQLGIPAFEVLLQPNDGETRHTAAYVWQQQIYVFLAPWGKFSDKEREFCLARVVASRALTLATAPYWRMFWFAVLVAGYVCAALNLWTILFFHSASLTGLVLASRRIMGWQTRRTDSMALGLTKDLKSAIAFLEKHEGKSADFFAPLGMRLEALRTEAVRLGIP